MKLAFIEPHLLPGIGGIRRIIEISNRMLIKKHDVSIYVPGARPCTWLPNKVPIYELSKIVHKEFDVVIFNLADQYKWALKTKAKKRVFWVLAPEAWYKEPTIAIKSLHQDFLFMANSTFTVGYINSYRKVDYGIPVVPGGINKSHFKYDPNMPKTYHVLYYGSKRPWKGASIIEDALSGFKLKLLKMEGKNTPQHKMYTLYNRCTLFVSAAFREGFSFPQLEAMACGCTVVTTDDGGSNDYVKNGHNAIVVERSISGIRDAVLNLLEDKIMRRKLRIGGLKTASNPKYDWNNVTIEFEKHLNNFLTKY